METQFIGATGEEVGYLHTLEALSATSDFDSSSSSITLQQSQKNENSLISNIATVEQEQLTQQQVLQNLGLSLDLDDDTSNTNFFDIDDIDIGADEDFLFNFLTTDIQSASSPSISPALSSISQYKTIPQSISHIHLQESERKRNVPTAFSSLNGKNDICIQFEYEFKNEQLGPPVMVVTTAPTIPNSVHESNQMKLNTFNGLFIDTAVPTSINYSAVNTSSLPILPTQYVTNER